MYCRNSKPGEWCLSRYLIEAAIFVVKHTSKMWHISLKIALMNNVESELRNQEQFKNNSKDIEEEEAFGGEEGRFPLLSPLLSTPSPPFSSCYVTVSPSLYHETCNTETLSDFVLGIYSFLKNPRILLLLWKYRLPTFSSPCTCVLCAFWVQFEVI